MTYSKETFTITFKTAHNKKAKIRKIEGNNGMTLDDVWASQRIWFGPGTRVTIADEHDRSKTFIKK